MTIEELTMVRQAIIPAVAIFAFMICGCAPVADSEAENAVAQEPQGQKWVSTMTISADCGVVNKLRMPGAPGGMGMGMGARPARDPVETDWDRVQPGYVVLEPTGEKETFLLGVDKEIAGSYSGDYYPKYTQLLPNGHRLYSTKATTMAIHNGGGSTTGCVEEYDANGDLVWRISLNNDYILSHHAVRKMPNGNVLAQVWQKSSGDIAVAQGRDPETLPEDGDFWFDAIIEIDPMAMEIVWEWNVRNHLVQERNPNRANYGVVADHPELLDINRFDIEDGEIHPDWIHSNAIDYHPELDQIVVSFRSLNEILIIDHSTTSREAEGHSGGRYGKGGDFLYRWGNPQNYGRGTAEDRQSFNQHDVQWIRDGLPGAGNLLIFNNGHPDFRPYTTIVEIAPERNPNGSYVLEDGKAYGPEEMVWEYDPPEEERFFASYISGVQRMPNGNTFMSGNTSTETSTTHPKPCFAPRSTHPTTRASRA
jgi:hypothetical protein